MREDTKQCLIVCLCLMTVAMTAIISITTAVINDRKTSIEAMDKGYEQRYEIGRGYCWVKVKENRE